MPKAFPVATLPRSDEEGKADGPALTEEQYTRVAPGASPRTLDISLISSRHSLWGHRLWNASLLIAGERGYSDRTCSSVPRTVA